MSTYISLGQSLRVTRIPPIINSDSLMRYRSRVEYCDLRMFTSTNWAYTCYDRRRVESGLRCARTRLRAVGLVMLPQGILLVKAPPFMGAE